MAPVPASPVLDCSDSGLSVTANVIGILTFVAALTLAAQLSLVEARRWLDHENFVIRIRSKEISDKIGRASKEVEDLGSQTLLQRFSQKSWYTDAMRRSDDTRIHHLQSLKSVCSNWWRDHKMLSDEVSSVVQFGFRIHRPLLWLARRRDQWLRAETEKLRKRLLYLENKLRFIDEYYPLSREPIDPDLSDEGFKKKMLRELAQVRGEMAEMKVLHGMAATNSPMGRAPLQDRGRRNSF